MSFEWPEPCEHEGRKVRGLCHNCYARAWNTSRKPEIDPRPLLTCQRCGLQWMQKSYDHRPRHCKRCRSPLWDKPIEGAPKGETLNILKRLIKLETDECILWPYGTTDGPDGYPLVTVDGKQRRGNITAWEIANKQKAPKGLHVRHDCDTPRCINPKHLVTGTPQDNIDDAVRRRRHQHGAKHSNATITEDDVRAIRKLEDMRTIDIAKIFGVTESVVYQVRHRITWRYVE